MRAPSREHFRSRLRRIARPVPQAGFEFWEEEDSRRLEALAGLLVARVALRAKLADDVYAVSVKPREFLGDRLFRDYIDKVELRIEELREQYRKADEALLTKQRRLVASFLIKPRRFVEAMGEEHERFEKSAHFWKYAESSKIRPQLH